MRSNLLTVAFLALSFSVACGDSGSGAGGSGGSGAAGGGGDGGSEQNGGGGASTDGGGGEGTGGMPIECELPTPTPGATNEVDVTNVTVNALDENGDGIGDTDFQLCGTDLCLYAMTDATGEAIFTNTGDPLDRPFLKPSNSLEYGKIGYAYTEASADPLVGIFPAMDDSGMAMTPGGSVSAGGVTLDIAAGAGVNVDTLIYDTPERQTFRAASIAPTDVEAVTGDPDFVMVYTLGPIDTVFCPGATVTFENYAGLPADTVVEIYSQELEIAEHFGPYGEWTKIADGVVSADGETVTTTGDGLPVLLSVAIKPAP